MRFGRLPLLVLVAGTLAACGLTSLTISKINARPDKYYEHKVEFTGRIARTQLVPDATLLEVVDAHGGRIIVRSPESVEPEPDDWIRVVGVLVPETHVGDAVLYDVVLAEHVTRTRPPRFMNLF